MRETWPKYLIIPSADDFTHGDWVNPDYGLDRESRWMLEERGLYGGFTPEDRKALTHCGTQCCLVGWAALAFGESGCSPETIRNPATTSFLKKVCELAGRPVHEGVSDVRSIADHASDAFEAFGAFSGRRSMTGEEALSFWEAAAEHFGYDTSTAKQIK